MYLISRYEQVVTMITNEQTLPSVKGAFVTNLSMTASKTPPNLVAALNREQRNIDKKSYMTT